ncbi:hypothetical protein [Streptomyces griseorubiginosus]|uniref:hypothetical protein n=1 Tax=Streptomyces griseorubiginosus TaxID=67304 RepID=UPI001AD79C1D|nr:hypothetical protein [Streptomyces griseorubiginosus]MBO4257507.1 hypothetical protein [Streptomyces griseorubiginosus]
MLISLILRVLPFYIREPLVIAICAGFAGLAFYWFFTDGGLARGGIGLMFLAVGVLRFFFARREWRSRRQAGVAAPAQEMN